VKRQTLIFTQDTVAQARNIFIKYECIPIL
jgi:hypothetical protein